MNSPSEPIRWSVAPRVTEAEQMQLGADSLLLAQLLWNRGLRTAEEATAFLDPGGIAAFADPHRMRGVTPATARLIRALAERELIAIYGDYDVDGVAGSALLVETFRGLGAEVLVHLPHRSRDGYGVHADAVRVLAQGGARVLVTVDCGISANQEIELAATLGMDVIVTDHHTVPAQLPGALAVLNPHQDGCDYPFKHLAGGGVAYQLARALMGEALDRAEATRRAESLASLAALSTVADIVPLTGENRVIVGLGLAALRSGARPALESLCASAGRPLTGLSAEDLAFAVIPRLNAAGRMGDARDALELLLAPDAATAQTLAARLEMANEARRDRVGDILGRLEDEACSSAGDGALVLAGDYPIGVAGLIAARLAERFGVPAVVIELGEETSRGSARGVDGIHLVRILEACGSCLIQYGGHARAAGFSLRSGDIPAFRLAFQQSVRVANGGRTPERILRADAGLRLSSIGPRVADLLDRFEPVGAGNPRPTFVSRGLVVLGCQERNGGHLRLRLAQGKAVCQGIVFRPSFPAPEPGSRVDVLYEVGRSYWDGAQRVELIIRDLRSAEGGST